ncbi:M1 family metallopeptidase [Alpinimonas psychrophila]|uniref:Aminopeptidase N n=1 Tax=Alpinimonas psychrophila TaxID=748908 RepID=A0A7W3PNP5_9MICO|nr:M1 family metallopeptidase [Alpinimonas psychrophila]MBA8828662.1 aminopeptidase [Alpinimonas psychrophila]
MTYSYDVDLYTPDSGNFVVAVTHYDLDLDYRLSSNRLQAIATLSVIAHESLSKFSLDIFGLVVTKVSIDGVRVARFTQTKSKLKVDVPQGISAGQQFTVVVKYGGNPVPMPTPWGEVGWEELTEGVLVAGQPCGASTWFPCSDHPRNKATYRFSVTADSPFYVVANGRLVSRTAKASRTRWVYAQTQPMPAYLATVQIGKYRPQGLPAGRIPFNSYIPSDLAEQFLADFSCQKDMMELFERLFGEYPFGEYTVVVTDDDLEIPLESLGISVFGRNHVDGSKGSNRLVAHEMAHSWFGNSVTVSTWKDIWLQEGFACYAEWLWSEESGGKSTTDWAQHFWLGLRALPQDIMVGDPGPALMFDDRVYKRGAITLHALRLHLGDDKFFDMLRQWTTIHEFGSVTTEDFQNHVMTFAGPSSASVSAVKTIFMAWLFSVALPDFPVTSRWATKKK